MSFSTRYLRTVALGAAALALVGCGTIQPQAIDNKQLESLKNQAVVVTTREKPDFAMSTPATVQFALLGALAAIASGNKLIAENSVEDPAGAISAGLMGVMEVYQGARLVGPAVAANTNDVSQLASAAKSKAKFLLDVQSGWNAWYLTESLGRYRVGYSARVRLINVDTQSVIAQGGCDHRPRHAAGAPTYDELWADRGAEVKKQLEEAAHVCVQTIAVQMFPAAKSLAMTAPVTTSSVAAAAKPPTTITAPTPLAPAAPATPVSAGATVTMPFVPDTKPMGRAAPPAPAAVPATATVAVVSPAQPAPAATAQAAAPTPASKKESRLQWLKQMRDANLITAGEYETKRQQVLSAP